MEESVWRAFQDSSSTDFTEHESAFSSALGFQNGPLLGIRPSAGTDAAALAAAPSFSLVQITGNNHFDAEAIRNFFVSYLSALPDTCGDLNAMQLQWTVDQERSEAVDALYGTFQNVFLHNPHLFRVAGNPPKVYLVGNKSQGAQDSTAEDELLSVATSVTSQLFSRSPDVDSPSPFSAGHPVLQRARQSEEEASEKDMYAKEIVQRLKRSDDNCMKKDELGSELVQHSRKIFDQICDLWGSLHDMLLAYPDLFLVAGEVPGQELVTLRVGDDETQRLENERVIKEGVASVLKAHYSIMHPDDLRDELHRTKPMVMGRITKTHGGFTQMLESASDWLEVVDDAKVLTPPFVRLRWPAFCGICSVWPETPEAWQGHVFSEKHKDMRRSVLRSKDGRDPDRWPVLRMIEERIRRAGGRMKLSDIPAFGKNRPLFATYVRKLYGGFKQLVESNPRFRVVQEDGTLDPTVHLVDDWRQDRLEGVVIRVKQKDTLIWIRPDTNQNIEFFLHKDRSLGGREIANSPAFVVPRVGDRMSFLPSDVPADPNPFAEGAVVLESVPDLRLRFAGSIVHYDRDRYLLRAEFQTAAGTESGDLFEVMWRDDMSKMAVMSGQTRVNFVRSCRPSNTYPYADDVTVDSMPPPRQVNHLHFQSIPHHHHHHHHGGHHAGGYAPPVQSSQQQQQKQQPPRPTFAFTSDATYRGRPAASADKPSGKESLSVSSSAIADARAQRANGRFGTWPVVVFDPNAVKKKQGGEESSDPSSGEVRSPQSPQRHSRGNSTSSQQRTPLKLNPAKPIVEFSFRGGGGSANAAANATLPKSVNVPKAAASESPPAAAEASAAAPRPVTKVPPSKEFTVKLDVRNDEAELLELLSPSVIALLKDKAPNFVDTLVSVALDVGALPVVSFVDGITLRGEQLVTQDEIKALADKAGPLGPEGSSVVRQTLHLCSTIRHPISKELTGFTLKVGRAVIGLADVLAEVVKGHASVLVLGKFCTGKTVLLRDLARRQSNDASGKLVAVVDTAGELGGAADGKSHEGLGTSRCVRCAKKGYLPDAVDATVGRHGIASVVVDAVCTADGVSALLRTRRRGVGVTCSIGAVSLASAACDDVFRHLLSRQPGGRKANATLAVKPPFDVAVELSKLGQWVVHHNINASTDALLHKAPNSALVTRVTVDPVTGHVKWVPSLYPSQEEISGIE